MSYRRKSYRRRSYRPRRYKRTYKKRGSFKRHAHRIITAAAEKKTLNSAVTNFASLNNFWHEYLFGIVAQGTTGETRIGNKIAITSININMILESAQTGTDMDDRSNVLRIVLALWDRDQQTTGVVTQLTDQSVTFNNPITHDVFPDLKKKYVDKFILFTPKGVDGAGYLPNLRQFKYTKKFKKPLIITFRNNAATAPDQVLALSMLSDSVVVPHVGATSGWIRWHYTDV